LSTGLTTSKMKPIEEIKPGLFVQQVKEGVWRVVHPLKKDISKPFSWSNINWKNLLTGGDTLGFFITLFWVASLLFICWAYAHDTAACRKLISEGGKVIINMSRIAV